MNTRLVQRILSTTLLGVMTVYMAGCSQSDSATGVPAPSTSVGTDLDDSVLTTRIKSALLDSMEIKSFDLKVETRKGEVMLSGFVDNQTQIDRAIAITKGISGVRSVDNKVSLKGGDRSVGNKIDDSVITATVKAELLADTRVQSADIAVVTRKAQVQLSGFVNNQGQIDRALAVARGVAGVSSVSNEMLIKK